MDPFDDEADQDELETHGRPSEKATEDSVESMKLEGFGKKLLGDENEFLVKHEHTDREISKGDTVIAAMATGNRDHIPAHLQLAAALEEADKPSRHGPPKTLVNPLTYGLTRIDYSALFNYVDFFDENKKPRPGLRVWRIENFNPVELPDTKFGTFYSADSYIVLWVSESEEQLISNIHHWVGKETTLDKSGASAIRSIELNMHLGGACHIYREEEGCESAIFQEYFDCCLEYMYGGTPSAFNHVVPNAVAYDPKLYHVLYHPSSRLYEVKQVELSSHSLNHNDVFVMDLGTRIIQWSGKSSLARVRHHAMEFCKNINIHERRGRAIIISIDPENFDDDYTYELHTFWKLLGGEVEVSEENRAGSQEVPFFYGGEGEAVLLWGSWDNFKETHPMVMTEDGFTTTILLPPGKYQYKYKVVRDGDIEYDVDDDRESKEDAMGDVKNQLEVLAVEQTPMKLFETFETDDGELSVGIVEERPLTADMLETERSYILDCQTEIFVWMGAQCYTAERNLAIALATKFQQHQRPDWVPVVRMYESAETASFVHKFASWPAWQIRPPRDAGIAIPCPRPVASSWFCREKKIDIADLMRSKPESTDIDYDDGSGIAEVFILTGAGPTFEKLPEHETGTFHSRSCYLVLYTYVVREDNGLKTQKYVAYFWEGREASAKWWPTFMHGFYPILQKKVGKKFITPVLVPELKEPNHFMKLFDNSIVIRKGSRSKLVRRTRRIVALFSIRVSTDSLVHACQVETSAKCLDSSYSFLLQTGDTLFVWHGKHSDHDNRARCESLASKFKAEKERELFVFDEGNERAEFWETLGGRAKFAKKDFVGEYQIQPRLFEIYFNGSTFEVSEILHFAQYDVLDGDWKVLLLDAYLSLYLLPGAMTSTAVQRFAQKFAKGYLDTATKFRRPKKPIELTEVQPTDIPLEYRQYFHAWGSTRRDQAEDPMVKRNERLLEDARRRYFEQKEAKRVSRLAQLQAIADQFNDGTRKIVKIDWYEALERQGMHVPRPETKNVPARRPTRKKDLEITTSDKNTTLVWRKGGIAVSVVGSWDNWEEHPMVETGDTFVFSIELPIGRFYYRYKVADEDGISWDVDNEHPSFVNDEGKLMNILRVSRVLNQAKAEEEAALVHKREMERKLREEEERKKREEEERKKNEVPMTEAERRAARLKEEKVKIDREAKEKLRQIENKRLEEELLAKRKRQEEEDLKRREEEAKKWEEEEAKRKKKVDRERKRKELAKERELTLTSIPDGGRDGGRSPRSPRSPPKKPDVQLSDAENDRAQARLERRKRLGLA